MAKGNGTEDVVNSVIDRFMGDDTDTGTDAGEGDDAGTDETSGADETGDDAGQSDDKSAGKEAALESRDPRDAGRNKDSKGGKGDSAGKQPVTGKGTKDGKAGPGPKDLVDPNTGAVLARAGHERRVWESSAAYTRQQYQTLINNRIQPEIAKLQGQVQAYEKANTTASQLQLTPEEQLTGLKLAAALRKDPIATIEYLLEQAKASGHNIDLAGKMAGIDANAVSRMVDGKLAPILNEQQQREAVASAYKEAGTELSNFYTQYPQARMHETEIDGLLQKFPDLNLETAYLKLQNFAYANGLDPNQPIRPQIVARNNKQQPNPADRRPNPGSVGRADPGVVANGATVPTKFAHEDTPYRDIVREAMREAGLATQN